MVKIPNKFVVLDCYVVPPYKLVGRGLNERGSKLLCSRDHSGGFWNVAVLGRTGNPETRGTSSK